MYLFLPLTQLLFIFIPPIYFLPWPPSARLVPQYLSYTISAGEDLRARLHGATPRGEVWWQQEPLQGDAWKQTNFTDDGALVIPAALLSGSGFYSFVNKSNVNDTSILGTLSLHIRGEPTRTRYLSIFL